MVARGERAEAADCEARFERQSGLRGSPRLIPQPEQCQRGGEMEMREGEIAVGLDAPAQPGDRLRVVAAPQLCGTGKEHPPVGDARQVRGQALGHTIHEVVLLGIAADVREWQNHDG